MILAWLLMFFTAARAGEPSEVERLLEEGKLDEALSVSENYVGTMASRLDADPVWAAGTFSDHGNVLYQLGEFEGAYEAFARSRDTYEKAGLPENMHGYAEQLSNLGATCMGLGEYAEGLTFLERAVELGREHFEPDDEGLLGWMANLAAVRSAMGDATGAIELRLDVIARREAADPVPHGELATDKANLAGTLGDLGQAELAIQLAREAVAHAEHVEGPRRVHGFTRYALGIALDRAGEDEAAAEALELAVASHTEVLGPDHPDTLTMLGNLASVYEDLGRDGEAVIAWEDALTGLEPALGPDHPRVLGIVSNLASFALARGDGERARVDFERVLDGLTATVGEDHPDVARVLINLGRAVQLDDLEAAAAYFERAAAIQARVLPPEHPDHLIVSRHLARIAMFTGDPQEAVGIYRAMLPRMSERMQLSIRLELAGATATAGDIEDASDQLELLLRDAQAMLGEDAPATGQIRTLLAVMVGPLGDPRRARELVREAAEIDAGVMRQLATVSSERERLRLVAQHRWTQDSLLSVVQDDELAYTQVLRMKGVVTRSGSEQDRQLRMHPDFDRPDSELRGAWDALEATRQALADASLAGDPAARQLSLDVDRMQRRVHTLAGISAAASDPLDVPLKKVCKALPKGAVLVDYLRYRHADVADTLQRETRYDAFVVDRRCRVERVRLGPAEVIDTLAGKLHGLLGASGTRTSTLDRVAAQLRDAVWTPLGIDATRVYVVPDGSLARISLAGLPTAEGYLVEQHVFAELDHAHDLLAEAGRVGSGSVLVGDVAYGDGRDGHPCFGRAWRPLPGTAAELEAVTTSSPGPTTILRGTEATEAAVAEALPGARRVHLATHGFAAGERCRSLLSTGGQDLTGLAPLAMSGVVLAGANEGETDGMWTGEEIAGLDLRGTELVVLSACDSGLGLIEDGEGVLGLRWAFRRAGVASLVSALWQVPDQATVRLMTDFYDALEDGAGPAEALTLAQRAALARGRHAGDARPSDWAAFIAVGVD